LSWNADSNKTTDEAADISFTLLCFWLWVVGGFFFSGFSAEARAEE
jgi:hypothetical protein